MSLEKKRIPVSAVVLSVIGLLLVVGAALLLLKISTGAKYTSQSTYDHPATYIGEVWIKLKPEARNLGKSHHYQLLWGSWCYTNQIDFAGYNQAFLMHKKEKGESPPIQFSVDLPCQITFGQGLPKGGKRIDINEGWINLR
jgi:hypothetical protein